MDADGACAADASAGEEGGVLEGAAGFYSDVQAIQRVGHVDPGTGFDRGAEEVV